MSKFLINLTISEALLLVLYLTGNLNEISAKENQSANNDQLSNLSQLLKQTNGVKVDALMDNKLLSNVSSTLNDMAANLRKMFAENRRLSSQVQDVLQRVQNVTAVNNNTLKAFQQQAANSSLGGFNLTNIMPRFN